MIAVAPSPHDNGQAHNYGGTSGGGGSGSGGPNDQIEAITGRRHLSWSQLNSYRGCPRRWWFSHVEGLKPDFVSSALILGSALHTAVQHHYEHRLQGRALSLDQLTQIFRGSWNEESGDTPIRYGKQDDKDTQLDLGQKMLAAFLTSELATPPGELIAIEETLTGPLHPEMPDLVARIDVVWRGNDGLHLMDLKTSRSRWSASKLLENADQLRLYQRLATGLDPDEPLHLHFGIVTKAKSPAVQLLDLPPENSPDHEEDSIGSLMLPVWQSMKAGVNFTSPSPMNCSTCGYRSRCPAYPQP